jgi:hypothetical protein
MQRVEAKELIEELTNNVPKKGIGESLFPLNNAKIVGEFDLKHQIIEKPVEIRNCEFEERVDLRYCEFQQVVDFSRCTFHDTRIRKKRPHTSQIYRRFIQNSSGIH